MAIVLFHIIAVVHFIFGNYFGGVVVAPKDVAVRGFDFGGPLIYLTNINFVRKKSILFIAAKVSFPSIEQSDS